MLKLYGIFEKQRIIILPIIIYFLYIPLYAQPVGNKFDKDSDEEFVQTERENRIRDAIDQIRLVDTHEHLITEKGMLKSGTDFFDLFKSYINSDLVSAGMTELDYDFIFNINNPLDTRWQIFYPYWLRVQNTGYAICLQIAVRDLFGIKEINDKTYEQLLGKLLDSHKSGWYNIVLKEKSGIDVSLIDPLERYANTDNDYSDNFFLKVRRFDNYIKVKKNFVVLGEKLTGIKVNTFDDYLKMFSALVRDAAEKEKIAGIKSGLAYSRSLYYENVPKTFAERIFNQYYLNAEALPEDSVKKLQDFLMHFMIEQAVTNDLPIQFHTGIMAGNWHENPIGNTNASQLSNLFLKYKDAKFVIFHGSYPYMGELSYLAKSFPNVYIDMCWMDIISSESAKTFLKEWLLTVPANKIMAFGGDIGNTVEMVYGHAKLARKIVADVLTDMVDEGYYSEYEAIKLANMLLRQNALELYKITKLNEHFYIGD